MSDAERYAGQPPATTRGGGPAVPAAPQPANLADILERVLDKGIVIAGDIQINLLDIELLTIKLRLLVASVDKAKEMGINWWEHDDALTTPDPNRNDVGSDDADLRRRVESLERRLGLPRGDEQGGEGGEAEAGAEER
jgi:Gas vesicle protein